MRSRWDDWEEIRVSRVLSTCVETELSRMRDRQTLVLPCPQTILLRSLCYYGRWWSSSLCPGLAPPWWTCPRCLFQSYFCRCRVASRLERKQMVKLIRQNWKKDGFQLSIPVSPNSPKILMKTSASVPLPFTSAVKTLTIYLLSRKSRGIKRILIYEFVYAYSLEAMGMLYIHWIVCIRTFGHVHGVHAAQQVSDVKAVSLCLAQPVVTSKVKPQVGPDHICHHHSVQEPAGAQPRVVVLNPGAKNVLLVIKSGEETSQKLVTLDLHAPLHTNKEKPDQGWNVWVQRTWSFSKIQYCAFWFWTHLFWLFRRPCDSWNHETLNSSLQLEFHHQTLNHKVNTKESTRKVSGGKRRKYST